MNLQNNRQRQKAFLKAGEYKHEQKYKYARSSSADAGGSYDL